METITLEALRYPIGKFSKPEIITLDLIADFIATIEALPLKLSNTIIHLNDSQLDTPYREGGWTIRQVVHHLPDSHANAYIRMKLAITEDNPTIKPYHEDVWAELKDAKTAPVEMSLHLLEGLHQRWTIFLKSLSSEQFKRTYYHPESKRTWALEEVLALYAWHCRHHLAHIESVVNRSEV